MNLTIILVASVAFGMSQIVIYLEDQRGDNESNKIMWAHIPTRVCIALLSVFVGIVVALISQDFSSSNIKNEEITLFWNSGTISEWVRATVMGFGAMSIMKKGSLRGIDKVRINNTSIKSGSPKLRQYLRIWWLAQ